MQPFRKELGEGQFIAMIVAHIRQGNLQKAHELCQSGLQQQPRHVGLLTLVAEIAKAAGKLQEVKEVSARVLQIQPQNYDALYHLGFVHYIEGNLPDALNYYRQALAVMPQNRALQADVDSLSLFFDALRRLESLPPLRPPYQLPLGPPVWQDGEELAVVMPQAVVPWAYKYKYNMVEHVQKIQHHVGRNLDQALMFLLFYYARYTVKDYIEIVDHLPSPREGAIHILDIGGGFAGMAPLLRRHYAECESFHYTTIELTQMEAVVHHSEAHPDKAFGTPLPVTEIARAFLAENGLTGECFRVLDADSWQDARHPTYDLVISMRSWGYVYPISAYLDVLPPYLHEDAVVITDVKQGSGDLELAEQACSKCTTILPYQAHNRIKMQGFTK